jgi:2-polyprenyl-6-methoxyphenol hydroxylase-like FAD-dependent oxidoreductase
MRILVVGAGIAGSCLSLALRDTPWHVDVVERRHSEPWGAGKGRIEPPGAGLAVQPNAMRALRRLGVADAVERAGAVIPRFQYRDQHGALLCDVDLAAVWAGVGPFVGIARHALHEILRPGRCRSGVAVTGLIQVDEEVYVSFDDGTTGTYDLVVGADGVGSVVRRYAVDGGPEPVHSGQVAWRSLAPVRPAGLDGVQFWLGGDRFFGLCPVGGGATYGFGNLADVGRPEPIVGRRRRLAEQFAGFGAPVREYLAAVDGDVHCAPVEWLPGVAWGRGRVVLVGDAAHAMSPMMGQGGCMAIEDAVVLAEELRSHVRVPTALTAFADRRRARVQWVRSRSEALGDLVRRPAGVRDRMLRERGAASFADRYRPLAEAA